MNKEILIATIMLCAIHGQTYSQVQPSRTPATGQQNTVVKKALNFECPATIQYGFRNVSPGWQEGFGGGAGMVAPFEGAFVSGSPSVLTCVYKPTRDNIISFTLVQRAPSGYNCTVVQTSNNDIHNRKFLCQPISNPPAIVPKSN